jgi:hypothetical protein
MPSQAEQLRTQDAFPATTAGLAKHYHPHLAILRGREASGVYAILSSQGAVLYVGESHTGRLYDTITRHFRRWRPQDDPQGRRVGGTTYDRHRSRVIYLVTAPGDAQDIQYGEIQRLEPRDNSNDGSSVGELVDDDAAPF